METLKELIQIVKKNRVRYIEILDNPKPTNKKTKAYKLYEGIERGDFKTDEDAAKFFYNDAPSNQQYRNLKAKLRKKLINTILFVDISHHKNDEYLKTRYKLLKKWTALKILFDNNAYEVAISMCKSVLKQAEKTEITEISIDVLKSLRYYYGTRVYNEQLFNKYDEDLRRYIALQQEELLAEGLYLRIARLHIKQKSQKEDLTPIYETYFEQVKNLLHDSSTSRLLLYAGMVMVAKHMNAFEYQETIDTCEKILSYLTAKPTQKRQAILTLLFQKLVCHTQLKQYEQGKDCISELDAYLDEGTFNWFKGKELNMYLLFHTQKYEDAYEVFTKVYNHKNYKKLTDPIKETWEIFRAYLHYLILLNLIGPKEKDKNFKAFRIGRFLNTVPTFSQDKRGFNIAILVIQIVFSILQKKYDLVYDRIEAIEKYTTRYLKKDKNFRSNCFIKSLLEIPKASFHRVGVERKTAKYINRLEEMPLEVANQLHSIEVLPYEDLWPLVLKTLENKRLDDR